MSKLDERRKKYGIPESPYLPMGKVALIYRIPTEEKTAGGLYIPGEAQEAESQGVLLGAGLQALDILREHLIDVGDVVWFARFAGSEKTIRREGGEGWQAGKILQLKVDEILGSVDALDRVGVTHDLQYDDTEGQHYYKERRSNGHDRGKRRDQHA